jgi:hypothetical protein
MKKLLTIFSCLWLSSYTSAEECRSLDVVEWILGEWTTSPKRVVVHEYWHRVSDATFEGESTTKSVTDGEVVNYETLRLVAMSDGVFYIAKVTHNNLPVPFRLTRCSEGIAVFENPAHDAPQRLIYKLSDTSAPGAPELEVRLEGAGMNDFSLFFHRP